MFEGKGSEEDDAKRNVFQVDLPRPVDPQHDDARDDGPYSGAMDPEAEVRIRTSDPAEDDLGHFEGDEDLDAIEPDFTTVGRRTSAHRSPLTLGLSGKKLGIGALCILGVFISAVMFASLFGSNGDVGSPGEATTADLSQAEIDAEIQAEARKLAAQKFRQKRIAERRAERKAAKARARRVAERERERLAAKSEKAKTKKTTSESEPSTAGGTAVAASEPTYTYTAPSYTPPPEPAPAPAPAPSPPPTPAPSQADVNQSSANNSFGLNP